MGAGRPTPTVVVGANPTVPPLGPHLRRPIGQIFVDLGFITPDDREAALTVQRENGGLLGEILITQGKITRLELANALSEHWESATGASDTTANRGPSLIDVPRGDESSRRVEPSDAAELRRLLAELEAARVAAVQAAEAGLKAIDEALAALDRGTRSRSRRQPNRQRRAPRTTRRADRPPNCRPRDGPSRTEPGSTRHRRGQPHRTDPGRRPGRARRPGRRPRAPARQPARRGQQEAIEAREGQEEAKALIAQASTVAETRRQESAEAEVGQGRGKEEDRVDGSERSDATRPRSPSPRRASRTGSRTGS